MTKSKDLHDVVIVHYYNGKNAPEISTMLANEVHHITVHRRSNQRGSVNGRKSSGRRRIGQTKRLINLIKRRVRSQSTRKRLKNMAKDFVSVLFFLESRS